MKGLAVGLNKGFITNKITKPRERAVLRKGTLGKRTSLVRKVVRECTGFAPYEKRVNKNNKGYGINKNWCRKRLQKSS